MEFETIVMGKPYQASEEDRRACEALWMYCESVPAGKADNFKFRALAVEHKTTPLEMNRHWKCMEAGHKCHER